MTIQERLDGFDSWLAGQMAAWKIPGVAVAVVHKGEVVLSQGYGLRDLEKGLPVTPETLFAIGSCSKAFTAFDMPCSSKKASSTGTRRCASICPTSAWPIPLLPRA